MGCERSCAGCPLAGRCGGAFAGAVKDRFRSQVQPITQRSTGEVQTGYTMPMGFGFLAPMGEIVGHCSHGYSEGNCKNSTCKNYKHKEEYD